MADATTGKHSTIAVACAAGGTPLTTQACSGSHLLSNGALATGCTPTMDGTPNDTEWNDATCFNVGAAAVQNTTVYAKISGDNLYLAMAGAVSCGCPFPVLFSPSGATAFDGSQFVAAVFDDAFSTDEPTGYTITGGAYVAGSLPAGVVEVHPSGDPGSTFVNEWKVPLSLLKATSSGSTFQMAIVHNAILAPSGAPTAPQWPAAMTFNDTTGVPNLSTWQTLSR